MNRACMNAGLKPRQSGGSAAKPKPNGPTRPKTLTPPQKDTDGKDKKGPPRPSSGAPSKVPTKPSTGGRRDSTSSRLSARASALRKRTSISGKGKGGGKGKEVHTIPKFDLDDENEDPTKGKCLISPTASFSAWQTTHSRQPTLTHSRAERRPASRRATPRIAR